MGCSGSTQPAHSAAQRIQAERAVSDDEGLEGDQLVEKLLSELKEGELFVDKDFEASPKSLYFYPRDLGLKWARAKDIVIPGVVPRMMVDGADHHDIVQGQLGDCWFMAACSAVAQRRDLLDKIIPPNQVLTGENYRGLVRFRFWHFGKWRDVIIDDQLPTTRGHLVYAHGVIHGEYWVALLEKAYAKLHGSYEALIGGRSMSALIDLTGGVTELYEISGPDENLFRHMLSAHRAGSIITCSCMRTEGTKEEKKAKGLDTRHAYAITMVARIQQSEGTEHLVRIRNPLGGHHEWNGAWGDKDEKWDSVDDDVKERLEMKSKKDGEFWMSFADFCFGFENVTICSIGPDLDGDGSADHGGYLVSVHGEWIPFETAGGTVQNLGLFATNPQYCITFTEPDPFDPLQDHPEMEGKCSVVMALMQDIERGFTQPQMGFLLYKADPAGQRLGVSDFTSNGHVGTSGDLKNAREVSARLTLVPGISYTFIPFTWLPNQKASFLIRVFSRGPFEIVGPL